MLSELSITSGGPDLIFIKIFNRTYRHQAPVSVEQVLQSVRSDGYHRHGMGFIDEIGGKFDQPWQDIRISAECPCLEYFGKSNRDWAGVGGRGGYGLSTVKRVAKGYSGFARGDGDGDSS